MIEFHLFVIEGTHKHKRSNRVPTPCHQRNSNHCKTKTNVVVLEMSMVNDDQTLKINKTIECMVNRKKSLVENYLIERVKISRSPKRGSGNNDHQSYTNIQTLVPNPSMLLVNFQSILPKKSFEVFTWI